MDEQQDDRLVLTAVERTACERVAAGEAPHSQRAQVVLALADGATVAETAAQTGLTENQVKLWRGRFRNGRLAVFPEELTVITETAVPPTIPVTIESLPAIAPSPEKKDKKEKKNGSKNKKKKDKKGKKKKKEKKGKKKSKTAKNK